jgi:hypothetical protein
MKRAVPHWLPAARYPETQVLSAAAPAAAPEPTPAPAHHESTLTLVPTPCGTRDSHRSG